MNSDRGERRETVKMYLAVCGKTYHGSGNDDSIAERLLWSVIDAR